MRAVRDDTRKKHGPARDARWEKSQKERKAEKKLQLYDKIYHAS